MQPSLLDYFTKNLATLKKNHPEIWRTVQNTSTQPAGEVFLSPGGSPNLRIYPTNGEPVAIHNEESPEKDGPNALLHVPLETTGTVVVCGIGLGYVPVTLCKKRPNLSHIVLCEPDMGIFLQALHHRDLTELFSDPRLTLHISHIRSLEQSLAPLHPFFQQEDTHFVINPNLAGVTPHYQQLQEDIHDHINHLLVNAQTQKRYGKDFLATRLANLRIMPHQHLFEHLHNAYAGIPAILVAGGPSLDASIKLLATAQHKAVIIAVDGALPALLAHDIRPDFLSAVDHKDLAHEKIAGQASSLQNTSLICTPTVNIKTPKRMQTEYTFWAFTENPLDQWMNSLLGGTSTVPEVSNVADLNIVAANILGCTPIILIGQDFALTEDSDHATHSVVATSPESTREHFYNNPKIIQTEGNNSDHVPTTRGWLSLKTHFETLISKYPGQYINSSEGGAKIRGTQFIPFREALNHYCTKDVPIKNNLSDILAVRQPTVSPKITHGIQPILNQSRLLLSALAAADRLTTTGLHDLSTDSFSLQNPNCFSSLPKQTQRQICILNDKISEIGAAVHIWNFLQDLTTEGLIQNKIQEERLKQLQNAPGKYIEYLQKSLKRILETNTIRLNALIFFEKNLSATQTFFAIEQQLIEHCHGSETDHDHMHLVAVHYLDDDNPVLARPILEKIHQEKQPTGEVNFLLGRIAALQGDHLKATIHFREATKNNSEYMNKIEQFRKETADYYFNLYQQHGARLQSLLQRGFQHCDTHTKISAELALMTIRKTLQSQNPAAADDLIRQWHKKMQEKMVALNDFLPTQAAELFAHYGQLCMTEAKFDEACESFQNALSLTPENPDYHILTLEASFSLGDFDTGIKHLNKAVAINPAYAKYWEEIGDSLRDNNQPLDALLAYEHCQKASAGTSSLMQKITSCTQEMNNSNTTNPLPNSQVRPQSN